MEFNLYYLVPLAVLYVIATGYLYYKKIRFRWFGLYPFGITFYLFNRPLEWIGEKFRRLWIFLGGIAYFVFGYLIIALVVGLPFVILVYWINIDAITQLVDPFRLYLIDVLLDLDLTSIIFYIVALYSIGAHEFMHGVVAKANGIPIENTGIIGVPGLLFAAYVKIDFFEFLKEETQSRQEQIEEVVDSINIDDTQAMENDDEEEIKPWIYIDQNGEVTDPPVEEPVVQERPIPYFQTTGELNLDDTEETEEELIDPFLIDDKQIRNKLAYTQSAGLLANLIFIGLAYYLLFNPQIIPSQYSGIVGEFISNTISVNIYLILFNLLPFRLFDGGKIFMNKLLDITTANRAHFIVGLFDRMFLFLVILAIIS